MSRFRGTDSVCGGRWGKGSACGTCVDCLATMADPLAEFCCVRRCGDYLLIAITPKHAQTHRYRVSVGGAEILAAEITGALTEKSA